MIKIMITVSSFGDDTSEQVKILYNHGFEVVFNPYDRRLTKDELLSLLDKHQPAGIIAGLEPLSSDVLEATKQYLRVISRVGVGWDNVDIDAAERLGIKVFRTEDAVTPAVVELTIGLFFCLARHICIQDNIIRRGQWKRLMGSLLCGRKLGIIGCGRIGKGVALSMRALGCDILVFDPAPDISWHQYHMIDRTENIEELIRNVDLLSIHASLNKDTMHLINGKLFNIAKPNLLIVNVARGEIIDESELIKALRMKKIAGAALDVFENEPYHGELCNFENVILTPHIGSFAIEARQQMEKDAVKNLLKGFGINA